MSQCPGNIPVNVAHKYIWHIHSLNDGLDGEPANEK